MITAAPGQSAYHITEIIERRMILGQRTVRRRSKTITDAVRRLLALDAAFHRIASEKPHGKSYGDKREYRGYRHQFSASAMRSVRTPPGIPPARQHRCVPARSRARGRSVIRAVRDNGRFVEKFRFAAHAALAEKKHFVIRKSERFSDRGGAASGGFFLAEIIFRLIHKISSLLFSHEHGYNAAFTNSSRKHHCYDTNFHYTNIILSLCRKVKHMNIKIF